MEYGHAERIVSVLVIAVPLDDSALLSRLHLTSSLYSLIAGRGQVPRHLCKTSRQVASLHAHRRYLLQLLITLVR